ncbi:MAG: glycosyltransferase family 39 protein [Elusimicrobia bacterium]|nr:glycosyltransferase family 39 protein [Elusimicrobiota bacterium]
MTSPPSRLSWRGPFILTFVYWLAVLLLPPFQNVALDDDWVYASAVSSIFRGGLQLPISATPNFVVQAWWGALFRVLFGPGYAPLRLSTLVLGWLGVLAFYDLLRQQRPEGDSGLVLPAALLFAFNPLFFTFCPSFMTDVPALSLGLVALALSRRACRDGRCDRRWLLAGSLFAALAYGIRQTAICIPAGLSVYYWRELSRERRNLWAVWSIPLAAAAGHQAWLRLWHGPTGNIYLWLWDDVPNLTGAAALIFERLAVTLIYCGLFSIPLAAAFWCDRPLERLRRLPARRWYPIAVVSAAVALFMLSHGGLPYAPLPWGRWGMACYNINGMDFRPPFFLQGAGFWMALSGLSWVSLATVGLALAEGPVPEAGALATLTFAPQFGMMMFGAFIFNRYMLVLVPALLLCGQVAASGRRRAQAALGIGTALMAVFSWAGTSDYLRATAAAWRLGEYAVAAGLPASEVHADGDWCFAYNEAAVNAELRRRSAAGQRISMGDIALSCLRAPQAVVTFKTPPRPPHELLAEESFFSPLSWRTERLYLYRRAAIRPHQRPSEQDRPARGPVKGYNAKTPPE